MTVLLILFPLALVFLYAFYKKIGSTSGQLENQRTFAETIHASKRRKNRKTPGIPAGPPVYELVHESESLGFLKFFFRQHLNQN